MMKKLVVSAVMVAGLACGSNAQTVNGIKLADLKADYIELREVKRTFSDKIFISMEYGQKVYDFADTFIKDDNNKNLEYNSIIDCVNKMKQYDYELFQVYINDKEYSIRSYILRKIKL